MGVGMLMALQAKSGMSTEFPLPLFVFKFVLDEPIKDSDILAVEDTAFQWDGSAIDGPIAAGRLQRIRPYLEAIRGGWTKATDGKKPVWLDAALLARLVHGGANLSIERFRAFTTVEGGHQFQTRFWAIFERMSEEDRGLLLFWATGYLRPPDRWAQADFKLRIVRDDKLPKDGFPRPNVDKQELGMPFYASEDLAFEKVVTAVRRYGARGTTD
jgi:hypothetical protein